MNNTNLPTRMDALQKIIFAVVVLVAGIVVGLSFGHRLRTDPPQMGPAVVEITTDCQQCEEPTWQSGIVPKTGWYFLRSTVVAYRPVPQWIKQGYQMSEATEFFGPIPVPEAEK